MTDAASAEPKIHKAFMRIEQIFAKYPIVAS
jgi:hypothetical protein